MKKILAICFCFMGLVQTKAQSQNPVKWSASYVSMSPREGEIVISAVIDKNWHTYSQQANNAVPFPTLLSFKESKQYQLLGKTEENNAHEEFDAALGAKLLVFTDKAEFKQKVKLLGTGPQNILIKVEYICCDNTMCLPPTTVDLSVKVQ